MEKLIIYTDGGSRNNPGIAGAGVYIMNGKGEELRKAKRFLGIKTNNWAEYEALILGLKEAKRLLGSKAKNTEIEVRMDSQLIVRQINGKYKVKNPSLFRQFIKVNSLKESFPNIKFVYIPRGENKKADRLANEAMDSKESQVL